MQKHIINMSSDLRLSSKLFQLVITLHEFLWVKLYQRKGYFVPKILTCIKVPPEWSQGEIVGFFFARLH